MDKEMRKIHIRKTLAVWLVMSLIAGTTPVMAAPAADVDNTVQTIQTEPSEQEIHPDETEQPGQSEETVSGPAAVSSEEITEPGQSVSEDETAPGEEAQLPESEEAAGTSYIYNVSYIDENGDGRTADHAEVLESTSTVWLEGWNVLNSDLTISSRVTARGDVKLILSDNCTLTVPKGITVDEGGNSLTIYAQSGQTGKLISGREAGNWAAGIGGASGWGSAGTISINGGTVIANGGEAAAGIGGTLHSTEGTITINGGTVIANGGNSGAGIGGGDEGNGGTITINGGTVIANGGEEAAGIGKGDRAYEGSTTITINGGTVSANGGKDGAGIGGGYGKSGGTIVITGGTITANGGTGQYIYCGGAGIGGGSEGAGAYLTIVSGNIIANGGNSGAGIGGGDHGNGGSATINGGTISVNGGEYGAGIGGGYDGSGGTITINGGTLSANGGRLAAGIGGGDRGSGGQITINGGTLSANGEYCGAGIGGGGGGNGGTIKINGGTVSANGGEYGAGIGGGDSGNGGTIIITEGTIAANGGNGLLGNSGGAGIGGGDGGNGGTITITGGTVSAKGGNGPLGKSGGAGIGGGDSGNGGTITITGGTVSANCKASGTGIGDGESGSGGTVLLSWTDPSDSIYAVSYNGTVTVSQNRIFRVDGTDELIPSGPVSDLSTINGKKLVPGIASRTDVRYIEADGTEHTANDTSLLRYTDTSWTTGWYSLTGDLTISSRVTTAGDVKLILSDNCTLTIPEGITVNNGNSFTIYGQSGQTGKLISGTQAGTANAGIGGEDQESGGTITVNGGTVSANGGTGAAGIGDGAGGSGATVLLSWTNPSGSIYADSYSGTVTISDNKYFRIAGTNDTVSAGPVTDLDRINGKKLVPVVLHDILLAASYEHGSVSASKLRAVSGESISLTVSADQGCLFESLSVKRSGGDETVATVSSGNVFSFIMPDFDVTVLAVFKDPAPGPEPPAPEPPAPQEGYGEVQADIWEDIFDCNYENFAAKGYEDSVWTAFYYDGKWHDNTDSMKMEYTGGEITLGSGLRVFHGSWALRPARDYKVSYRNNKKVAARNDAKPPSISIKAGKNGRYKGSRTYVFDIEAADIGKVQTDKTGSVAAKKGTKLSALSPKVSYYGKKLKAGKDCEVLYYEGDAANASKQISSPESFTIPEKGRKYLVTLKGKGNFKGESKAFIISSYDPKDQNTLLVSKARITDTKGRNLKIRTDYNGKVIDIAAWLDNRGGKTPKAQVRVGKKVLTYGEDYTVSAVSGDDMKSAGKHRIVITGTERMPAGSDAKFCIGSRTFTVTITGKKLKNAKIAGLKTSVGYQGRDIIIEDLFDKNDKKLEAGWDGVSLYTAGKDGRKTRLTESRDTGTTGDYIVYITNKGSSSWIEIRYYEELVKDQKDDPYAEDTWHIETIRRDIERGGSFSLIFVGVNGYTGTVVRHVTVRPYNIKEKNLEDKDRKITVSAKDTVYRRGGAKPEVTVKFENRTLREGIDYKLSYRNNRNVAENPDSMKDGKKPAVIVTGIGNYKGKQAGNYFAIKKADVGEAAVMSIEDSDYDAKGKAGYFLVRPVFTDNGQMLPSGNGKDMKKLSDKDILYTYVNETRLEDGTVKAAGSKAEAGDRVPAGTQIKALAYIHCSEKSGYTSKEPEGTLMSCTYRVIDRAKDLRSAKASVTDEGRKKLCYNNGYETTVSASDIKVVLGGSGLDPKTDYEVVSVKSTGFPGKASVTIRGIGDYGGRKKITCPVGKKDM